MASDVSDGSGSSDDGSDDEMMQSLHSDASGTSGQDSTVDTQALIQQLQDRKHNNSEARENLLESYIKALRTRFSADASEWLNEAGTQLADIFLRDANRSPTARERLLSLKAYCLTVMCSEEVDIFDKGDGRLKQVLTDDDDEDCKEYAIYAIGLTTLYGGGDEDAALNTMEYLTEIVQSDGESAEAYDSPTVVAAAMRVWNWIAAHVDDYSALADTAMDSIVEQLDSADTQIQILAAESIALIFESSRNHESENGEPFQLPYDPKRLAGRIEQMLKQSSKSVSRHDRRNLRDAFRSVVTSLERGVGPNYSTAETADTKVEYGYRQTISSGGQHAVVRTWSLSIRYDMLKTIFKNGVSLHVTVNPVAKDCIDDAEMESSGKSGAPKRRA